MKAIELTLLQQEKLLEMCKALFPEYKSIQIGNSQHFNSTGYSLPEYTHLQFRKIGTQFITIHWFEFCNTWLVEKVLNPTPERPSRVLQDKFKEFFWKSNLYWMYINEYSGTPEKHPVDYLYEEFKKLPIKDDKVTKAVYKCIERITGINESELTTKSKLSELGLDDLDEVELIMDLEKELKIVIPDDDVETKIFKKGNTIQTLVDYLKGKL